MHPAIQVDNLYVRYRGKRGKTVEAVNQLSFTVEPGEVVGFLGSNGAGKSSTLKALMGFVQPQSGRCETFGQPAGSIASRSRIGYLPEVAMYYPFLTPFETLNLYGELQGLAGQSLRNTCYELLELVGLQNLKGKQNRQLSKGMLQRVGIAQALLGSPELLILDEVTSGLDPIGRQELRSLLKERQSQGTTLFFSSHELSEVEMLCDRILVINNGALIEERRMDSLKSELQTFAVVYQGPVSLIDLAFDWEAMEEDRYWARFKTKDALLNAIARIHREGKVVEDVVSEEGSLEDYFIETIRRAA